MTQTCFIHIGAEKCGSTSIQKSIEVNHSFLRANKLLVPKGLGRDTAPLNHTKFVVASYKENQKDDLTSYFYRNQTRDSFLRKFQLIVKEKENLVKSYNYNLLLSAEHFSSRLKGDDIGNFKKLVNNFSDNCKIILIIRNQIKWHVSAYNTFISCGGKLKFSEWVEKSVNQRSADWELILSQWAKYFPIKNFIVLPLSEKPNNKSLEHRFYKSCSLSDDCIKGLDLIPRMNESKNAYILEKIRQINLEMPWMVDGFFNKERNKAINDEIKRFENQSEYNKKIMINNFENQFLTDDIKNFISNFYKESNENISEKFLHLKHELKFQ